MGFAAEKVSIPVERAAAGGLPPRPHVDVERDFLRVVAERFERSIRVALILLNHGQVGMASVVLARAVQREPLQPLRISGEGSPAAGRDPGLSRPG